MRPRGDEESGVAAMKRERCCGNEESGVAAMKRAASRLYHEIFFVGEVSASVLSNEIRYLPYLNLVPTEVMVPTASVLCNRIYYLVVVPTASVLCNGTRYLV